MSWKIDKAGDATWIGDQLKLAAAIRAGVPGRLKAPGAKLRGVDLRGVDIRQANLRGALCKGIDLRDADIRGADFTDADLRSSSLNGADIRGIRLHETRLAFSTGIRHASVGWSGHGDAGQTLLGAVVDGEIRLWCGFMWSGTPDLLREHIAHGDARCRASRTRALEILLELLADETMAADESDRLRAKAFKSL